MVQVAQLQQLVLEILNLTDERDLARIAPLKLSLQFQHPCHLSVKIRREAFVARMQISVLCADPLQCIQQALLLELMTTNHIGKRGLRHRRGKRPGGA